MNLFPFAIKHVTLLKTKGPDKIIIVFDGPTTFPRMNNYQLSSTIEAQAEHGEQWLADNLPNVEYTITVI